MISYQDILTKITNLSKIDNTNKYIIISVLVLIIIYLLYLSSKNKGNQNIIAEGFSSQFVKKTKPLQIYDEFYAEIYDQLFQSDLKNEYECVQIQKNYLKNWNASKIKILDAGCGTGHHLRIFKRYGHHVEGVDISPYMLKKAQKQCPTALLKKGDFNDETLYEPRRFTHITCLFFTIYYYKNLTRVFRNFNKWLQPNGLLFVHVVIKEKFDPVLERASSLIPLFDPQKHQKDRATHTQLEFKEFTYESDWNLLKPKSSFQETIRFKNEPYDRQHIHRLYLVKPKTIITKANNNGFVLIKAIDLFLVGHNHNYLMCFKKKYGD